MNGTVYPEAFYGPVATTTVDGVITPRTWLMLFQVIFAGLLLAGHFWHGLRSRAIAAGYNFSQMKFNPGAMYGDSQFNNQMLFEGLVVPQKNDPQIGMLDTPVSGSPLTQTWVKNLPIYRAGLAPIVRGLEIGMAHGYLLLGPFLKLGPLRNTDQALLAGLGGASGLVVILSVCLFIYGGAVFQGQRQPVGNRPDNIRTYGDWSLFTSGFLVGGLGGVIFAGFILFEIGRSGLA